MSFELMALLVYTVGVKCRGINKKETYAPEHVFSLSENTANKLLKENMTDLIKHNQDHIVRIYPKGAGRHQASHGYRWIRSLPVMPFEEAEGCLDFQYSVFPQVHRNTPWLLGVKG
jgi:hypothetical protein